jgi:hypothetical protein
MSSTPADASVEQTDVGSYFIADYPPFSAWQAGAVATLPEERRP